MMVATFNGNPSTTTISCYSPTNVSEETDLIIFYDKLSSLVRSIPTKQRTEPRVPWETLVVREKCADVKTTSKFNRKNPTNINALKLKKAQNELANIYLKEQTEYIQNQINKIRDLVEDRQSRIEW